MSAVTFELSEFRDFFSRCKNAARGEFKKECEQYLEALGQEFLRILEDEIIRRKVMDTRLLLNSFHKDSESNVWIISDGGLTLEVGTSVKYAGYVNDGHWTVKKGQKQRFIPGFWDGDSFTYDPNAEGGMLLKQQWVPGAHYWEAALRILDAMLPSLLDAKLQEWLDRYFT